MRRTVRRREVLRNAAGAATLSVVSTGTSRGQSSEERFSPERHGFGFRNWSSRRQAFESPNIGPDPGPVSVPAAVREYIRTEWTPSTKRLLGIDLERNDGLLEILTSQLRSAIVQQAGTNGHCYGMALAAQAYFEAPDTLPLDRPSAASIQHPMEPLSTPDAPLYQEIIQFQAAQLLRFRAWLGRRALLWPDRIDATAQLDDIRSVIDVFGTAQVSLFDSRTSGHQVLAYDYDDRRDGTTLYVYDPNRRAEVYEYGTRTIEFQATDEGYSMEPYGKYEWILFNRYDRIEGATDRTTATPLDHVDLDAGEVREAIFPMALVTVDTADVDLTVVAPDGGRFGRLKSEFMNRSRGPFQRLRSGYGVAAGEYRIYLKGHRPTSYEIDVRIAGPHGVRLSVTRTAQIKADETQVYAATVPETADGTETFEAIDSGDERSRRLSTVAVAVGSGIAVGAGSHYLWTRGADEPSAGRDE